ncbi:MAG: recombinase RecT [bacterium]
MENQALQNQKKDNFLVVRDLLEKSKNEIAKALPKSITPERVARIALTTLRKNPGLLECDPNSFLGAVMQSSQLGFELDDNLGLAYLVPFKNKKTGRKEAQLIIGYRGLIELARRSGKLKSISARIVYENEPFSIEYGLMENLKHTPLSPSKRGANIKGVYAVAAMNDDAKVFEFLWADELDEIKKSATAKAWDPKSSPWTTHEEEMMKKTVIRKMMKYLSLSPEAVKATVIDEYGESGINTKDMFIDVQAEKTAQLGLTEPKALTQEKVTNMSAYRPQADTGGNNNGQADETGKKAETGSGDDYDYGNESAAYNEYGTGEDSIPGWVNEGGWDGENQNGTASGQAETQSGQNKQSAKTQSGQAGKPPVKKESAELISEKQISFVNNLCKHKGIYEDQMPELISTVIGEEIDITGLTKKQATVLIDYLKEIA